MNQTVSSSKGRSWLTNLNPAVTAYEVPKCPPLQADVACELPKSAIAEKVEVKLPSRHEFQTEAIYQQLTGIGGAAVTELDQLKIPTMSELNPNNGHQEVVFVDIPRLGADPSVTGNLTNLAASSPTPQENESYDTRITPASPTIDSPSTVAAGLPSNAGPAVSVDRPSQATEMNASSAVSASQTPSSKFAGGEIGILVEKILDRFPLASPTILLFVGGEPDPNVESTCTQVANALAGCHVGNVLLIDGDLDRRELSNSEGMTKQNGLAEVVNRSEDWRPLVATEGSGSFSFLPAGTCPSDRWNANELLRQMSAEMKQDFQFICVAAGDAHTKHAKLWCDVCDGSYLVVSMQNSNETLAKSAVAELTNNGARVLGCVVADAQ